MVFRIQSGEAVFQFELRPFRVNSGASARLRKDLAFFRGFYRALGTALILSRAGPRAPVWSRSVRLGAKLSPSLAEMPFLG